MKKFYFSQEENKAYDEGRKDERHHRHDYNHDKYATDGADRAYWDGRIHQHQEEKQHQLQEQQELEIEQQQEERRYERHKEEQRQLQEQEKYLMEEQRQEDTEAEMWWDYENPPKEQPPNDFFADEIPITEEDLFRQIKKDEIHLVNKL